MIVLLSQTKAPTSRARLLYIDNLRWAIIILVVSMHAADTYSPLGNWYFTDRKPLSPAALLTFAAWQMYLQSFFMGLLFFIAGYFVPYSFDRKGGRAFLRDRAIRLGLPVLLYMFLIGPVTEYYVAHSWTSTRPTSFAHEWIKHIQNGQFLQENGPLWFCLALLIFSAVYVVIRPFRRTGPRSSRDAVAPGVPTLLIFAAVMAIATFLVRIGRPSSFLNMQLGDFPQYILLFAAGIDAGRRQWLSKLRYQRGIWCVALALSAGLAAWLALLIAGGALHGRGALYSGGWHWQSFAFCFWQSFTCVALSFGLLVIFRERFNSQGRTAEFLSRNAFSVYVFHPPVLILIARVLTIAPWHSLFKFALLTATASLATFALSVVVRRIPLLNRIL